MCSILLRLDKACTNILQFLNISSEFIILIILLLRLIFTLSLCFSLYLSLFLFVPLSFSVSLSSFLSLSLSVYSSFFPTNSIALSLLIPPFKVFVFHHLLHTLYFSLDSEFVDGNTRWISSLCNTTAASTTSPFSSFFLW